MNTKPAYQQVFSAVKETQDNKTLRSNDAYGLFLLTLIRENTEKNTGSLDAGEVDTEELASNLRYGIDQFQRALNAVEKFNR